MRVFFSCCCQSTAANFLFLDLATPSNESTPPMLALWITALFTACEAATATWDLDAPCQEHIKVRHPTKKNERYPGLKPKQLNCSKLPGIAAFSKNARFFSDVFSLPQKKKPGVVALTTFLTKGVARRGVCYGSHFPGFYHR